MTYVFESVHIVSVKVYKQDLRMYKVDTHVSVKVYKQDLHRRKCTYKCL